MGLHALLVSPPGENVTHHLQTQPIHMWLGDNLPPEHMCTNMCVYEYDV